MKSRSHSRRVKSAYAVRSGSGAIISFLIIAGFGILFTGCSPAANKTVTKGLDDVSFTEQDLAKMRAAEHTSASGAAMTGVTVTSLAASGSISSIPAVDVSQISLYDAIRSVSASGKNGLYKVTNEFANVRAAADLGSASVGRLENGNPVKVVEFVNAAWAKVELAPGKIGYISTQYLSKPTTEEALAKDKQAFEGMYFVDFAFVNMRSQPSQQSEKIGQIPGKIIVKPLSMDESWARVSYSGKEGYISTQYLSPFVPNFVVRQDTYTLPVLVYQASQPAILAQLPSHMQQLKSRGFTLMNFRDLHDLLLRQENGDARLPPKSVVVAVAGITPDTIRGVSDTLYAEGVKATLFLDTKDLGLTGITEKMMLTLNANGFDIESATHTGQDLRALTDAQVKFEAQQSRYLLEKMTQKPVYAVLYPQGGVNDRVKDVVRKAGYLFGIVNTSQPTFTRADLLTMPSYTVNGSMTADDVIATVIGS
ncbi:MAG: xylanase/chitin deacetylase [Candidatus Peribacteria bacterium]|nr:xylanase/chitin deacetylase [Candidatus Peribacteria bacterium]